MLKLNLDKNILIFSSLAVITAFELFLLLPLGIKKISVTNRKINQLRRDIEIIEKDWPHKEDYLKHSGKIKAEIQDVYVKFVIPQEESSLFSFISSESKNYAIDIKSLKPLDTQDYASSRFGKFQYLPISIKAQGNFHSLAKFLDYLQSGKFFLKLKSF
jgi:hypothetical protein